jgi:hypothetical protein
MDTIKPVKVKFKLENQIIEDYIENSWTIGKIKGKIRKFFKLNPYYTLQLLYNGAVLENDRIFKEVNYIPDTTIKVLASRTSEI